MDVTIDRLAPRRMVRLRHTGPYEECGEAWGKMMAWAGQQGLFGPRTWCAGLSHDDPHTTPPEEIRYDACVSCPPDFEADAPFEVFDFEGGEYAGVVHRGSYEALAKPYDFLYHEWLPKSGREPRAAPCVEVYRNSMHDTPPEELETEVWIPLAPGS